MSGWAVGYNGKSSKLGAAVGKAKGEESGAAYEAEGEADIRRGETAGR